MIEDPQKNTPWSRCYLTGKRVHRKAIYRKKQLRKGEETIYKKRWGEQAEYVEENRFIGLVIIIMYKRNKAERICLNCIA